MAKKRNRRKRTATPSNNGHGKIEANSVPNDGGSGALPSSNGKPANGKASGGDQLDSKSILATGNRDYVTTRDVRLVEGLIRCKDWNIPDVALERVPQEMALIALGRHPDHQNQADKSVRAKVTATRALTSMYGQNQANHPLPQQHEHKHVHADLDDMINYMEAESRRLSDEPTNGQANS
jgi:hypothetical protein